MWNWYHPHIFVASHVVEYNENKTPMVAEEMSNKGYGLLNAINPPSLTACIMENKRRMHSVRPSYSLLKARKK